MNKNLPKPLNKDALNQIFLTARSYKNWQPIPIPNDLLEQLYNLTKWGPTSFNDCPMRIIFVANESAKERMMPAIMKGNVASCQTAPVTVILAYELEFWRALPRLSPHADVTRLFKDNPKASEEAAIRDGNLQAGYFIMAARALGLDCGPMVGFDKEKINQIFFPNSSIRSNFLCNIGYADRSKVYPRGPRLDFNEVCKIL